MPRKPHTATGVTGMHEHQDTPRAPGEPEAVPDGVLVQGALDARVPEAPEAFCDELQAGDHALHLGRVSAGQLHSTRGSPQDVQDSLEDGSGRRFSGEEQNFRA